MMGEATIAGAEMDEPWLVGRWACQHGVHCSCRLLAIATGAAPGVIDYNFCRRVLQQRWRMSCDHIPQIPRVRTPMRVPRHDSRDPIHLLLIANADLVLD